MDCPYLVDCSICNHTNEAPSIITEVYDDLAAAVAARFDTEPEHVAAFLNGTDAEADYFEQLALMAADAETSDVILNCIMYYCWNNEDHDVQTVPVYLIEAEAIAIICSRRTGIRHLTVAEQLEGLDWEIPHRPSEMANMLDPEIAIKTFQRHNRVELAGEALAVFKNSIGVDGFQTETDR